MAWLGYRFKDGLRSVRIRHLIKQVQYVEPLEDYIFLVSLCPQPFNFGYSIFGYINVI
jgi:hypothetical protein